MYRLHNMTLGTAQRYRHGQLICLGWNVARSLSLTLVALISGWLMLSSYGV